MSQAKPVQTVVRSLRVLEALAHVGGGTTDVGVVELARLTKLSPATTHRLLATLVGEGYVVRDEGSSRYRLGPQLFALSAVAESEISWLRSRAAPAMEALRDAFGETVNLARLDRRHIIYVDQIESELPVRAFYRTGNRVLAHASAAGKALLAFEPEALLDSHLTPGSLEALTTATITSPSDLRAHLAEIRRLGYALDLGEQHEDVVCVAAAIVSPSGRAPGALSVSGPATRMRRLTLAEVGASVAATAAGVLHGGSVG